LFLRVKEGDRLDYTDRTTADGKTLFSYEVPGEGTWVLLFQRQNNSTGDSELAEVTLYGEEPLPSGDTEPIAVEEPLMETPAPTPVGPAATGDIAQAQERLKEIEENPEKVQETLDLLEFLIDASSDDEALAGYYYRTARTLEMNSLYQDLRKAYETYEYIRDTFFLTDYYELAQERLRFLDRHFFKLR
ncbi:MAG: hypothetical protein JXA95_15575, partial [Spirochaetales bacterium]|nr:hypothetical protein [Spirochaetales bacterium]